MRRLWIVTLIVAAVASVAAVPAKVWVGHMGSRGAGELYQRCAVQEGVEATYVEDLRVDDTTVLSTTIVEAITDEGWAWMCRTFRIPPIIARNGNPTMTICYTSVPQRPEQVYGPDDGGARDLVVIAVGSRTLRAYHLPEGAEVPVVPMFCD